MAVQILKASEDYLETMLMMQTKHGYVRSVDVAEHLGVTKPSVTYATKRLRENGYIEMDKDGLITLTDAGMQIASKMLQRHQTLTRFLVSLGVDPETAEEAPAKWSMTSATRPSRPSVTMPGSVWPPPMKQRKPDRN